MGFFININPFVVTAIAQQVALPCPAPSPLCASPRSMKEDLAFLEKTLHIKPFVGLTKKECRKIEAIAYHFPRIPRSQAKEYIRFERYLYALYVRIPDKKETALAKKLLAQCQEDTKKLHEKWTKYEMEKSGKDQCFFTHPDLVDFIFQYKIHRVMRHPQFDHQVEMLPYNDQLTPVLLVNGKKMPWMDNTPYRNQETGKMYKDYLYQTSGIQQVNLETAPLIPFPKKHTEPDSKVEIVLAKDNAIGHAFIRLKVGTHFKDPREHPSPLIAPGTVYSFGFGPTAFKDKDRLCSPDTSEFYNTNEFQVTTIPVTNEQVTYLINAVKTREQEAFCSLDKNCCYQAAKILRTAQIIDIPLKEHLSTFVYHYAVPKVLQKEIDKIPWWITKPFQLFFDLFFFLVFFISGAPFCPHPLFSLGSCQVAGDSKKV